VTQLPDSQQLKSWWDKPEGKAGMAFLAVLIVGAGAFLYKALPYLIIFSQNILHLAVLLAIIFAIGYSIMDPKVRMLIGYAYRTFWRKITGMFIELDPINVLKIHLRRLAENLNKMDQQLGKLKGEMATLRRKIEANSAEIRNCMDKASAAKKANKLSIATINANQAARLEKSSERLGVMYTNMEKIYRTLDKMYQVCGLLYEDNKNDIEVRESEWKSIQASYKAMKSAMSIISGNPDERAMYEQTLEFMAQDLGQKVGEMDRFLDVSKNFMDGADIEAGVFDQRGLDMLEKWEHTESTLLGNDKVLLLEQANNPSNTLEFSDRKKVDVGEYATLFKNK
jgi:phage shock protein A